MVWWTKQNYILKSKNLFILHETRKNSYTVKKAQEIRSNWNWTKHISFWYILFMLIYWTKNNKETLDTRQEAGLQINAYSLYFITECSASLQQYYSATSPHSVTTQKTITVISTAMRISNLKYSYSFCNPEILPKFELKIFVH